jgi:hypothetical protein
MAKAEDLKTLALEAVEDGKVLLSSSKCPRAVYCFGLAVELGLKWKICNVLNWKDYPDGIKPQEQYSNSFRNEVESRLSKTFKIHDLPTLLALSGQEEAVSQNNDILAKFGLIESYYKDNMRYQVLPEIEPVITGQIAAAAVDVLSFLGVS